METLPHFFDVFRPDTGETLARCENRLEADYRAIDYAKQHQATILVYECTVVSETCPEPSRPTPGSKEKS